MASLLFKNLAASLTRQAAYMTRLNLPFSSPAASAYRCLSSLTTASRTLLLLSARASSIQPSLSGSFAQCGPSLLGQCQHLPCIQPSAGMKTKTSLRRRCKDCYFTRRRGRLFVLCRTHPRHKQRQG